MPIMLRLLALLLLVSPAQAGRRDPPANVADAPRAEATDFRFGPGDHVAVSVWRHPEVDADLVVAPDGTATFPLLGRLAVAGRGYGELLSDLENRYKQYYSDAVVSLQVIESLHRKVYVVGEVQDAAALQISGEMTILEALVRAGGIHPDARTDNLLLVRAEDGGSGLWTVDVDRLLAGDSTQNVPLQAGDIVVVPARTIVNVERFFRRVQGILSPFVAASQIYRNTTLNPGTQVIDDAAER